MSFKANNSCVSAGDQTHGTPCKYEVLENLGEGSFGKVTKCRNQITQELVAVKFLKKDRYMEYYFQKELYMMNMIKELDPDIFHIIKFIQHFELEGSQCMAFEILDQSIEDLLLKVHPLSLVQIRPMAKQLLTALVGLQSIGVLHLDIKPDNIMLVNHQEQPFRVKLIDFGLAKHVTQVKTGEMMQPIAFRAPEVTLGLPLCEAIDMWSLACCFIDFHLDCQHLTTMSEFDNISMFVDLLGLPAEELLKKGLYSRKYFIQEGSKWRLKTVQEYKDMTGECPEMYTDRKMATLEKLIITEPSKCHMSSLSRDEKAFCDLLKRMFEMDPKKRISPAEALSHPFITMEHLQPDKSYTNAAQKYMQVTETDFEGLEKITESTKAIKLATSQNFSSHDETDDCDNESTAADLSLAAEAEASHLEFTAALKTVKEELAAVGSYILEDTEEFFQDGGDTEPLIAEAERKAPTSVLSRLQGIFTWFKCSKPHPKKRFFSKPKVIKNLTFFKKT